MFKTPALITLIALVAIALAACDSGTKESADKTVEETKEAVKAAGDTMEKAASETADATKEAVDAAATEVKEATKE